MEWCWHRANTLQQLGGGGVLTSAGGVLEVCWRCAGVAPLQHAPMSDPSSTTPTPLRHAPPGTLITWQGLLHTPRCVHSLAFSQRAPDAAQRRRHDLLRPPRRRRPPTPRPHRYPTGRSQPTPSPTGWRPPKVLQNYVVLKRSEFWKFVCELFPASTKSFEVSDVSAASESKLCT